MIANIIGFIAAFLFSLSCIFSIISKLVDVEVFFEVKYNIIKVFTVGGSISLIIASIYLIVLNSIF